MSVNIPSGSTNPIGQKMPYPDSPIPMPSGETKDAIQQAMQERDAPRHLYGDEDAIHNKGLGDTQKEQDGGDVDNEIVRDRDLKDMKQPLDGHVIKPEGSQ